MPTSHQFLLLITHSPEKSSYLQGADVRGTPFPSFSNSRHPHLLSQRHRFNSRSFSIAALFKILLRPIFGDFYSRRLLILWCHCTKCWTIFCLCDCQMQMILCLCWWAYICECVCVCVCFSLKFVYLVVTNSVTEEKRGPREGKDFFSKSARQILQWFKDCAQWKVLARENVFLPELLKVPPLKNASKVPFKLAILFSSRKKI